MAQQAKRYLLSRFTWLGFFALVFLALTAFLQDQTTAALAAIFGAAVILTSPALPATLPRTTRKNLHRLLVLVLVALILASLKLDAPELRSWLFLLPLILAGLLPSRLALVLVITALAVAVFTLSTLTGDPGRHQMISPLILTTVLTLVFFFMREYKSRQLAPLRRTDELTQAASRDYLSADLHKEIQRSEREGTDLSVLMLGLDAHLSEPGEDPDIRALLPRIGRFLHSQLRDFDSYYRVADLQFLVTLPGLSTAEATRRAEQLRKGLMALMESHGLALSVSAGVAGLNIGDDVRSLQHSAATALQSAQKKGGDRVQTYSAWSHPSPSGPSTEDAASS